MKLSTVFERTVVVSRWFHSTTVLTKNECFNCSVLQCSTAKLLLFFDVCLSKMFVVSQFSNLFTFTWRFQIFSLSLGECDSERLGSLELCTREYMYIHKIHVRRIGALKRIS